MSKQCLDVFGKPKNCKCECSERKRREILDYQVHDDSGGRAGTEIRDKSGNLSDRIRFTGKFKGMVCCSDCGDVQREKEKVSILSAFKRLMGGVSG